MRTLETSTYVMFEPIETVPLRPVEGLTVGTFTPDHRIQDERHSQVQLVPATEFDAFYEAIDEHSTDDPDKYGFRLTTSGDGLYYWLARTNHRAEQIGSSLFNEKLTLQRIGSRACRLSLPDSSPLRSA